MGLGGGGAIYSRLKSALDLAVQAETSGLNFDMWGTLVSRDGTVCAVARSSALGNQWPGSRAISAQKANTANAFSLPPTGKASVGLSLSTANLYSVVQPGGSLYGLQASNPVDTQVAYQGPSGNWGSALDPMVGEKIGGLTFSAAALPSIAQAIRWSVRWASAATRLAPIISRSWRVRHNLGLHNLAGVGGVSGDPQRPANIIFDIIPNAAGGTGVSAGGFGHPKCINTGDPTTLPPVK